MSARSTILLLLALSPCVVWRARADDAQVVQVEARSRRKLAATHPEDPSASGTSLDLTDRVGLPRSLGDVVREVPGAQVVSTGGIGAYSTLSLRGAAAEETLVLLDEIPLSTPDGRAFDLSLFPVELFASVNTFRGGAPVWLGSGAIGGVLQLMPYRGEQNRARVALGAGSFGTYQLSGGLDASLDSGLSSHSALVVRGTQGNFPYRDEGGTVFDRSDDHSFRLKNADFTEASGLQDLTVPLWGGRLHLLALGLQRGGGFPGPAAQPTPKIRRESSRALVAAAYSVERGDETTHGRKLQVVGSGGYGADRFKDVHGQLGVSSKTNTDNHNFRTFVRAAGSLFLTRWLVGSLVSSYAFDAYLPKDAFFFPTPPSSSRHALASALELAVQGKLGRARFELRPSARVEWSHTDLHASAAYGRGDPSEKTLLAPTARLGAVIEPVSSVALSASVATGTRPPSLYELFGDGGGLVRGNFDLRPVASTTYDGGLSYRTKRGVLRGRAELRGFWQERRDSIVLTRSATYTGTFQNVAALRQWGAESNLTGSLTDYFHVSGSFTWLETETTTGKRLPFRPRYMAYFRPEGRIRFDGWVSSASVSSELWYRSFAFYDLSNLPYTPACTKLGFSAALGMFQERLRFSARMDDSLDARCTDLLGYPLPGRSLFFSLSYREADHEQS